jgi:hypothetical protein
MPSHEVQDRLPGEAPSDWIARLWNDHKQEPPPPTIQAAAESYTRKAIAKAVEESEARSKAAIDALSERLDALEA